MTPEQKAAFINAQTALCMAERAMMEAENNQRIHRGASLAYTDAAFGEFFKKWEPVLEYNAVIKFFND